MAPSVSLNDWFNKRAAGMVRGQVYDPLINFALSGRQMEASLLELDYKDIARGWLLLIRLKRRVAGPGNYGRSGKDLRSTGIRNVLRSLREGITNSFDRNGPSD